MSFTSVNDALGMQSNAEFAIPLLAKHATDAQSGFVTRTATAANYTAVTTDNVIAVTSTAAARTITIPSGATATAGKTYIVKDESGAAGTNHITLSPASGTIDGGASVSVSTNYGVVRVYSDGTNWFTW